MRKQFPACKKIEDSLCKEGSSRHHKHKELSASASIPQRKEEGARAKLRPILDSVRINTSAGALCLTSRARASLYALLKKASTTVVHSGALTITRSKWLPAFARSHWRRQDVAHADVKRDACARSRTKLCSAGGRTRDRTSCCTGTLTPTYEIVLGPLLPLKIKIQKINASSRIT